jgi:hypothetical protein
MSVVMMISFAFEPHREGRGGEGMGGCLTYPPKSVAGEVMPEWTSSSVEPKGDEIRELDFGEAIFNYDYMLCWSDRIVSLLAWYGMSGRVR